MGKRIGSPTVNAGSMADIAFLLLIFFLVTTTIETEAGLDRLLPRANPTPPEVVNERNILEVQLNKDNKLMVEGKEMSLDQLRPTAIAFIDNAGEEGSCSFCKGAQLANSALKNDRETRYDIYIAVQNELVGAYHSLRNREAQRLYKMDYTAMEKAYRSPTVSQANKQIFKTRIKELQGMYPLHIVEPKN